MYQLISSCNNLPPRHILMQLTNMIRYMRCSFTYKFQISDCGIKLKVIIFKVSLI